MLECVHHDAAVHWQGVLPNVTQLEITKADSESHVEQGASADWLYTWLSAGALAKRGANGQAANEAAVES